MEAVDFEQFFRCIHPRIVRFAKRKVDAETANDIAAYTLETVWRKNLPTPQNHDGRSRMEQLTFSVANGLLLNALRSAARRSRLEAALAHHASTQVNEAPDPADLVIRPRPRQLDEVVEMLVRIPIREREVLAYFAEGYRITEIAAILDKRPGTISMRLRRARQRLRILAGEAA